MKKKLCKNGKIQPSPLTDYSWLLPATVLTLAETLSAEDREVLAYLISWNTTTTSNKFYGQRGATVESRNGTCGGGGDDYYHSPVFECNCFRCYMNFWARWDASPSRQLIHEIIEAYEEGLSWESKNRSNTRRRRKERGGKGVQGEKNENFGKNKTMEDEVGGDESVEVVLNCGGGGGGEDGVKDGSVRKILSFIGEKIWGVWNRD